jgi:hypothetical protein
MVELEDKGREHCGRGGDTCEATSSALPSKDIDSRTGAVDGGESSIVGILSGQDDGGEWFELSRITLRICDSIQFTWNMTYLELVVNLAVSDDVRVAIELAGAFLRFARYPRVVGNG